MVLTKSTVLGQVFTSATSKQPPDRNIKMNLTID